MSENSKIKVGTVNATAVVANTITGTSSHQSVYLNNAESIKSWLHYDMTTPEVFGSMNITSVTDVGTGNHTMNYTNDMASASYGSSFEINPASGAARNYASSCTTKTVSTTIIVTESSDGAPHDLTPGSALIAGELA